MPSKKRAGLSKREFAAKQVKKPAVKRASALPTWSGTKTMAEVGGLNPAQQAYQNKLNQDFYAGKQQTGVTPYAVQKSSFSSTQKKTAGGSGGSSKPDTKQRTLASQGLIPNSSPANAIGQNADGSFIYSPQASKPSGASNFLGDIFSSIGKAHTDRSMGMAAPSAFLSDLDRSRNAQSALNQGLGIPTAFAGGIPDLPGNLLGREDTPYSDSPFGGLRNLQEELALGQDKLNTPASFVDDSPTDVTRRYSNIFGAPKDQGIDMPENLSPEQRDSRQRYGNVLETGNDPTLVNEMDGGFSPNDFVSTPPEQTSGNLGTTPRTFGSGAFGTGKGVGNPAGEDPYIKELRKAYSSNGGEKWLRKQFEELIKALDPTYAQMQKEGTDALNANLNNQNTQLASVMNANNTGDSEQRAQMMARQQGDTQTAIGALLAKLATAKAGDVSGYKSQMAQGMSQLAEKKKTNQQRLLEQIQQYKQQQYSNSLATSKAAGSGRVPAQKNMSLKAIGFDKFGNENLWVDQSTGDIYDNGDFQQ